MKKLLICIAIMTMILSVCSCKVRPQNIDEEIASGSTEQAGETSDIEQKQIDEEKQAFNDVSNDKKETDDNQKVTEAQIKKVTLTDATEKYLDIIKNTKNTENTKEQLPTNKEVELGGEKIKLTFKEKAHIVKLSSYRYDYTDSNGNIYKFHEDDGFIGIQNYNTPSKYDSFKVTEQEALEIAKNYANKLFSEEFDKYTLWTTNKFDGANMSVYSFSFSKNYGADSSLHGEICVVDVYENGSVKSCDIEGLYAFKGFDSSLVSTVTKETVDKAILDSLSKQYENFDEYDITIEGYELLQYVKDKWVIAISVSFENNNGTVFADSYFIEIN